MHLKNIFKEKTIFSLEVFPPHTKVETQQLINYFREVSSLKPDFISIASRAGGSENIDSINLSKKLQNDAGLITMPHITGLSRTKADVLDFLNELEAHGIQNVLALRGDQITDQKPVGDFNYASELVQFINKHGDFDIAGACYPQKHPESLNFINDMHHLKEKINQGISHLITQMLFDNQTFYDFKERIQLDEIDVPVEVGIMPCTNRNQIKQITELTGMTMPKKFIDIMDRYRNDPEAMHDAGIAYAINQIYDLTAHGVQGIHLYSMNNLENANKIWNYTHNLFNKASNHEHKRL